MGTPFLGQIELFAFPNAPKGWMKCDGSTLPINGNQALFALIGTTFGGDGKTNFKLPDLQGRIAVGYGQGQGLSNYNLGQTGGEATHILSSEEMGDHLHYLHVNTQPTLTSDVPSSFACLGNTFGQQSGSTNPFVLNLYGPAPGSNPPSATLDPHAIGVTGASNPHPNMMLYTALNYCICVSNGTYPSPT